MSNSDLSHDSLTRRLTAICIERGVAFVAKVPIGPTPFDRVFKADLVLDLPDYDGGLAVIARNQDSGGSAEEKLCHLALCITRSRRPCLVVLGGEGWSDGAQRWMAARKGDRVLDTVDLDGFNAFLVAALRGEQ